MIFDFTTVQRLIFGIGSTIQLPDLVKSYGQRGVVYCGKHLIDDPDFHNLTNKLTPSVRIQVVAGEPVADVVEEEVQRCQNDGLDYIVSIGGGSVIDFGKAVSILVNNPGRVLDFIEVVGKGLPFTQPAIPFIAIPTTAGTGSEVTRNAVIKIPEYETKASLRHVSMLPAIAIVDPEWMATVPPAITASTGFDAITQVLEPFLSTKANMMTDSLCKDAILAGIENLPHTYESPQDLSAREKMAYVSVIGGIALANAGLGAVHAFAAAIGGSYDISHGEICAALLPAVLSQNVASLQRLDPGHPTLAKVNWLERQLNSSGPYEGKLVRTLIELQKRMGIKTIEELGVRPGQFELIATKALRASSMKGNPIQLGKDEMISILESSSQ